MMPPIGDHYGEMHTFFPSFLIQMSKLVNRLNDLLHKHSVSVHSVQTSIIMLPLICTKPLSKTINLTLFECSPR